MLTHTCPDCHGEMRMWKSRYGGNDPDVWDAGPCPNHDCEDGEVPIWCEGWKCHEAAVRIVEGAPLCDACARETEAEIRIAEEEEREIEEVTT